jgi:ATP-dependent DNA helicase RecG
MIVYGDTDISIIREHPEGRETVATHIVKDEKRGAIYDGMKKRMAAGEQCLVICPVIERTEDEDLKNAKDMFINLRKIFYPKFRLDLIHGQISSAEKERIMEEFRKGDIDLLVGTTVVEVGVHAPGATILVVEHPERFGLAQLHQLRGRVGRGSKKGLSIFMLPENIGEAAMQRLKILAETSDGFEIAKKDLELRGQGELMGLRQAGAGEIDLMEIMEEPELLMEAKRAAEEIIESDPELRDPGHRYIKKIVGFQ